MQNNNFDIKFLILDKLNLIEELTFQEAQDYEFETSDIVTATRILTLIQNGTFTSTQLAKKLNISRQAIHKSITNLCEKEYLHLENEKGNRKNKNITVTKKGEQLLSCRKEVLAKVEKRVEKNLGKEDYKKLKELLAKQW